MDVLMQAPEAGMESAPESLRRGVALLETLLTRSQGRLAPLPGMVVMLFVSDDASVPSTGRIDVVVAPIVIAGEHWYGLMGPGFSFCYGEVERVLAMLVRHGASDAAEKVAERHDRARALSGFAYVLLDDHGRLATGWCKCLEVNPKGGAEA